MNNQVSIKKINYWSALLLVASFPFGYSIVYYTLSLWILTFGIEKILYYKEIKVLFNKNQKKLYLFIPYFLLFTLYALSIFFKGKSNLITHLLETKLSFFAFPVILIFSNHYFKKKLRSILSIFIISMLISALYSLSSAFYNSLNIVNGELIFRTIINDTSYFRGDSFLESVTQGGNYFYGSYLSPFLHTTYYSMYFNFAMFFIIFIWNKSDTLLMKILYSTLLLLFSLMIFLIGSKGSIIAFIISIMIYFGHLFLKTNNIYRKIITFVVTILIAIFFFQNPRLHFLIQQLKTHALETNNFTKESSTLRIKIWKVSIDIIKNNFWLGVGVGKDDELISVKLQEKYNAPKLSPYNSHNQYLTTLMQLGLLGLIVFLCIIILPGYIAIKKRNFLLLYLLIIIAINSLFETLYGLAIGYIFINFFYSLLLININNKQIYAEN